MLVDTGIWIDWIRGCSSVATRLLDTALDQGDALLAPVIVQELVQGARNEQALKEMKRLLIDQPMLMPNLETHLAAAEVYARCRWRGLTVRSPHDCLIACLALEHGEPLLAEDRDYRMIQQVLPDLELLPREAS